MAEWECVSEVNMEVIDIKDNKPEYNLSIFTAPMPKDTVIGAIGNAIVHDTFDLRLFTIDPNKGIVC